MQSIILAGVFFWVNSPGEKKVLFFSGKKEKARERKRGRERVRWRARFCFFRRRNKSKNKKKDEEERREKDCENRRRESEARGYGDPHSLPAPGMLPSFSPFLSSLQSHCKLSLFSSLRTDGSSHGHLCARPLPVRDEICRLDSISVSSPSSLLHANVSSELSLHCPRV
jgi:hypothetical protein